ncbi:MAG: SGNH/GDSL hydrolase family protein [Planctomycetota bacterium]|nr:SGNH/GDSL hydrolase family protein [Planctomycetota bacterium]MDA1139138.1 SGNH/GDSL hydrolase family protein [Planctomycetota bacterium]
MTTEEYIESFLPSREQVENFLAKATTGSLQPNRGWTHDPELGWVHDDTMHEGDGVNGTRTYYNYEKDGARRVMQFADQPCRLHTYGDSFTHCDQVNDGETWQEYLAGHIGEPIRNYGVGGYSVYQAYRRMRKIHREGQHVADHIILNIYDDDHFRNLDAWRRVRFGRSTNCGFTLPHMRVNVEKGECIENGNLLSAPEDVYKLCDRDWSIKNFKDDPVLKLVMATKAAAEGAKDLEPVAVSFGLPADQVSNDEAGDAIRKLHTEAALFATKNVIELTEQFVAETGKKLMVVLSFNRANIRRALAGESRFDQTFVDYLSAKSYPVIDMRECYAADFENSRLDPDAYLKRYYNGHQSPAGNFFSAWSLMDKVVEWLEPKPRPYS